jgi:predicted ABC-class ATPase
MGIPEGITLIIGGGYHGKSTLLRAIELGVYDHIPGDGRERVVTVESAVKIRAEDGRSIAGIDISNFIDGLPGGQDTRFFHSENASGSTSQAAGIVEALEVGTSCLLLDEDTCATNFMIRDARMQRLVPSKHEPITPFIDRAKYLSESLGISTVAVVGGAGDYFDVADCVIGMLEYVPYEQTEEAKGIAIEMPSGREEISRPWIEPAMRRPKLRSLDSKHPKKEGKVRVRDVGNMQMGDQELQLGAVEQLVEEAQVRAIAYGLLWARNHFDNPPLSMSDFYRCIMERIENEGLQSILGRPTGDCAEFRITEMAAVLGRLRSLQTELV